MDFKVLEAQKARPHEVLKRIKYKSGQEGQRYIEPDASKDWSKEKVTFEHLDAAGYATLLKARRIKPVATSGKGDK